MAEEAPLDTGLPEDIAEIFRLDGQYAAVTGAASGLGKAIALGFAHFGANVACMDIDLAGAEETAGLISGLGRNSSAARVADRDWDSARYSATDSRQGG